MINACTCVTSGNPLNCAGANCPLHGKGRDGKMVCSHEQRLVEALEAAREAEEADRGG